VAAVTGTVGVLLALVLQFAGIGQTKAMPLLSASSVASRPSVPVPTRVVVKPQPTIQPTTPPSNDVPEALISDRDEHFLVTSEPPRERLRRPTRIPRDALAWTPFRRKPAAQPGEFASGEQAGPGPV